MGTHRRGPRTPGRPSRQMAPQVPEREHRPPTDRADRRLGRAGTQGSASALMAHQASDKPRRPPSEQPFERRGLGLGAPASGPAPAAPNPALPHLQPLDGLLAARGKQDALVQAGHGGGTAGQGRERGRGAHAHQGVGHCGEIVRGLTQLRPGTVTVIVLKVGRVYGGREGEGGQTDGRREEKEQVGREQEVSDEKAANKAQAGRPDEHMQGRPQQWVGAPGAPLRPAGSPAHTASPRGLCP